MLEGAGDVFTQDEQFSDGSYTTENLATTTTSTVTNFATALDSVFAIFYQ